MSKALAKIDPQEKARKARQKAFIELCTECREELRRFTIAQEDRLRRLEELATTGQTSDLAVYTDFVRAWEKVTGDTYDADIRVGKATIKRLLKRKPAKVVRERMIVFFHDSFAKRQGYKITAFGQMFDTMTERSSQEGGAANLLNQTGWFDQ